MIFSMPYFICHMSGIGRLLLQPSLTTGRHFEDDIFKRIFLNANVWILIKILLKFVPKGPINNITALVQKMACRGGHPIHKYQSIVNSGYKLTLVKIIWLFLLHFVQIQQF